MSLEEQAKTLRNVADEAMSLAMQITDLCNKSLEQHNLGDEGTAKWNAETMQKFINHGKTLIAQLKAKVAEFP